MEAVKNNDQASNTNELVNISQKAVYLALEANHEVTEAEFSLKSDAHLMKNIRLI